MIFSWSSWLAVLLVGTYARLRWRWSQDGGHTPANRLTETYSRGLYRPCLTLDIHVVIQTQNRRPNHIQKTSLQRYKTQIKILSYLGLAWSSFKQPGVGAPLLGLNSSIYYPVISCHDTKARDVM